MQDHGDKEKREERREEIEERRERREDRIPKTDPKRSPEVPKMRPPEGGQPFSTPCCHLFGLISGPRAGGRGQRKERRDKRKEKKLPPARIPAFLQGPVATSNKV